jgi:hypothetical protein
MAPPGSMPLGGYTIHVHNGIVALRVAGEKRRDDW